MPSTWVVDGLDGDQGGAEVAYLGEQAVQLSLVGHCAAQGGSAVVFADQGQSAEPGRPVLVEVPLYPEFIVGRSVRPGTLIHRDAANTARVRARPDRRTDGRRMTHSATAALTTQPDDTEMALLRSVMPRAASPMPSVNAWVPAPTARA